MEPTKKSPEIESSLSNLLGASRLDSISDGSCTTCDTTRVTEDSFDDELSLQEYKISGMCQYCQDLVFVDNLGMCENCGNTYESCDLRGGMGFDDICQECLEKLISEYEQDQIELNKYRG